MAYIQKKLLLPTLLIFIIIVGSVFIYKNVIQASRLPQQNESPKSKTTIVYSYGGQDLGVSAAKAIELFQKSNPDIEVKLQKLPNSTDYNLKVYQAALSSGDDSLDVLKADIIWVQRLASSEWALPLDNIFDSSVKEKFYPKLIEACTYKNKLYAIPSMTDAPFLFYRSDIIQEPPKTYAELESMCRKYRVEMKYGYVLQASAYEGMVCNALEFIWNNGGNVIENNKIVINSPEAIGGLQLFADIVNSDISGHDVLTFDEEDSRMAFQDGNALFMRNWSYACTLLNKENSKVKGKFGVAPLPVGPMGKLSSGTLGGWNYMINKYSKNVEQSRKFVEWMTSYEMQSLNYTIGGYPPTLISVYDDKKVKKINPWSVSFTGIMKNTKQRPVSPSYPQISDSMQLNFFDALIGKIPVKTAISNIESDLRRILAREK